MITGAVIVIALISIAWAYFSLWKIQKGLAQKEQKSAKKNLEKRRVVFHSSSLTSSSSTKRAL